MIKKILFSCLFVAFTLAANAQIDYESGFFITNANEKVPCLILNMDWKNNPSQFEYKLSEDAEVKIGTIKSVKEFSIGSMLKYVRETVQMERSSGNVQNLSNTRVAQFQEETVFLKVLVSGEAILYGYEDGNLNRFFYQNKLEDVEPLIFKRYLNKDGLIAENNRFRQQLYNAFPCKAINMKNIEDVSYQTSDLVKFFIKYNTCVNNDYKDYTDKGKQDLFNLTLRPGVRFSSLTVENALRSELDVSFDDQTSFTFGVEAEFIMGFNKNKWSVIIEPTYQAFKSEGVSGRGPVSVEYKSIEFPVGVRHYMFLGDSSKLFVNVSYVVYDLSFDSSLNYEELNNTVLSSILEIESRTNLLFGFGYKYDDKYSIELQYATDRNILSNFVNYSSDYSNLSVKFGYTLF